jgi:hypothetical protein
LQRREVTNRYTFLLMFVFQSYQSSISFYFIINCLNNFYIFFFYSITSYIFFVAISLNHVATKAFNICFLETYCELFTWKKTTKIHCHKEKDQDPILHGVIIYEIGCFFLDKSVVVDQFHWNWKEVYRVGLDEIYQITDTPQDIYSKYLF